MAASASAALASSWDDVAEAYERLVQPFTASFAPALLEHLAPLSGQRVLDVAAGAGAVALLAAAKGAACVVATDVSPRMLELLEKAAAKGATSVLATDESPRMLELPEEGQGGSAVTTLVAAGESLPHSLDSRFDVAISSFGLIFFEDVSAGLAGMARALRPGGTLVLSAWGSPEETEAFGIFPKVLRRVVPSAQAKPRRIVGSPDALRSLLEGAGLCEVRVSGPVTRTLTVASPLAYYERFVLGGPDKKRLLSNVNESERVAVKAAVVDELARRFGNGPVSLPASAYIAVARTRVHPSAPVPSVAPASAASAAAASASTLGRLRVGTAGFASVAAHWAGSSGIFPPGAKGKHDAALDWYQEKFDTCEVNATAHAMPHPANITNWRGHCAAGCELALKVVASVTHSGEGIGSASALAAFRTFMERAALLGSAHLGPLLVQLPRSAPPNVPALRALAQIASQSTVPPRIALEVRNRDWLAPEHGLLGFLQSAGWALVQHPNSMGRATVSTSTGACASYELEPLDAGFPVTADFVYVRLHGRNDEHQYRYTDEELRPIAAALHGWRLRGLSVYAFVLSDDERGAMAHNAHTLRGMAHALAREPVPRAPKEPRGLGAFFKPQAKALKRERGE